MTGHGTRSGYRQHLRARDVPCAACVAANTEHQVVYRFISGRQHHPRTCRDCGSIFPAHDCHLRVRAW